MQRTILITRLRNRNNGETKEIYGRYDPVAINKGGWDIIETYKQMFTMTDADFALHGTRKGGRQ